MTKRTSETISQVVPRFTVDPDELQYRKDIATQAYNMSDVYSLMDNGTTGILKFQYENLFQSYVPFAEMLAAGWTIPLGMETSFVTVLTPMGGGIGSLTEFYLMKPLEQRTEEIKVVHQHVEQKYREEIAALRAAEVDRQVEFQLQAERRKELAAQQAKEVADRQRIRDEVSASIAGGK
jgi:hypothetical protein